MGFGIGFFRIDHVTLITDLPRILIYAMSIKLGENIMDFTFIPAEALELIKVVLLVIIVVIVARISRQIGDSGTNRPGDGD